MAATTAGHHIRINAVDTKANILAIGTANNAVHGRAYLPNDAKESYIGNYDGTLTRLSGASAWVAQDNGSNTISVADGATLSFLQENLIKVRVDAGTLKFGLNVDGLVSGDAGKVPTWNGSAVAWTTPPPNYITGHTDSTSIDFTVSSGNLTGTVILDTAGDNAIVSNSGGLYSKKYVAGNGININNSTNEISVTNIALTDVTVDTTETSMTGWVSTNYTGTEFQEGDSVILTNATGGREAWIHNGGTAGTIADWTELSDELTASEVRGYLSATSPILYNSSTGVFSLAGLSGVGSNNQVVISNGTTWGYTDISTLAVQAYKTIQEEGTSVTQRNIINFIGSGITVTDDDVNSKTSITLDADLNAIANLSSTGFAVRTATDTWSQRTIAGTTNRVVISNGNGVLGNPTIDIDSNYVGQASITTVGTITSGTWNGSDIALDRIAQLAGLSILGRSANTTGDMAAITAASDGHVLRRSGTSIGFGTISASGITNSTITYDKIQNAAGFSVLGRSTSTTGVIAEISATANTVLWKNGAGNVTFSALDLSTAAVTGILPMSSGGMGVNLGDPNADNIVFWDDSAGQLTYLTLGTGLTISGTELQLSAGSDTNPWGIVGGTTKANAMSGINIWTNNKVYIGDGDGSPAYTPVYQLEVSGDIAFNNALHGIVLHTSSGKYRITASSEDGSLITLPV